MHGLGLRRSQHVNLPAKESSPHAKVEVRSIDPRDLHFQHTAKQAVQVCYIPSLQQFIGIIGEISKRYSSFRRQHDAKKLIDRQSMMQCLIAPFSSDVPSSPFSHSSARPHISLIAICLSYMATTLLSSSHRDASQSAPYIGA